MSLGHCITRLIHRTAHPWAARRPTVAVFLGALCGILAGCGDPPPVSLAWPNWGNTPQDIHFSPASEIDAGDVGRLETVWRRSEGPNLAGWETFPVVVGGVMYYTTDTDEVEAVDAATGRLRWSYMPHVDFFAGPAGQTTLPVSRGVAVGAGRVYDVTFDDQLIALQSSTGRVLWNVQIANARLGYAETSPAVYWNGELIVGGPAGDAGLRGFVAAFSARTGRQLWRTYMVPSFGSRGSASRGYAGGDVWMPPVVDPASATVYVGTGNPTPAFRAKLRAGCDRWTDATVALNARSGAFKWGHTEFCNDSWDYDTDQSPELFDIEDGHRTVRVVGDGNKAGFYSVLDASTGAVISRSPTLTPYSLPHKEPNGSGAVVCPGNFGGLQYGPPAYSPETRDLYVSAVDMCMRFTTYSSPSGEQGSDALGGTATPFGAATGVMAAIDPVTGRVRWRRRLPRPAVGGVLATAGGLVFSGDNDGRLYAFDARTGRMVWHADLGLRFGSAPIAYELGGREFIAIAAGGSQLPPDGGAPYGGEMIVMAVRR